MGHTIIKSKVKTLVWCLRRANISKVLNLGEMVLLKKPYQKVGIVGYWFTPLFFNHKILIQLLWTWLVIIEPYSNFPVPGNLENLENLGQGIVFVITRYKYCLLVSSGCFSTKCFDWTLCSVCSLLPFSCLIMHDCVLSTLLLVFFSSTL